MTPPDPITARLRDKLIAYRDFSPGEGVDGPVVSFAEGEIDRLLEALQPTETPYRRETP